MLWATIWAHPRTPAHALSYLPLRHLYRHADAIATYGPHVSAYVRAKGARGPVVEAPQSVDDAFWAATRRARASRAVPGPVCRPTGPGKGRLRAPSGLATAGLSAPSTALVLVGDGPIRARAVATGAAHLEGPQPPERLRNFYAGSDVVVVPSIPTRDFLEPWGLVVNEAFDQGVPVIATDAVGAAAGGLVAARAHRPRRARPATRARWPPRCGACTTIRPCAARLGAAAREAVRAYSHAAWAAGMSAALRAAGASGKPPASVDSMLRLVLACLLLGLVAVPAANAASTTQILRDCADDGVLQGDYSPSELRKARQNIPTDTDEYTDCRDVLARAAAAGVAGPSGRLGRRRRWRLRRRGATAAAADPGHARGPRRSSARPARKPRARARCDIGGRAVVPGTPASRADGVRNDLPRRRCSSSLILLGAAALAAAPRRRPPPCPRSPRALSPGRPRRPHTRTVTDPVGRARAAWLSRRGRARDRAGDVRRPRRRAAGADHDASRSA